MSTATYKCPCCGSALEYAGASGKLECASCGNAYDPDAISGMNDISDARDIAFDMSAEGFSAQDAAKMHGYVCQSCGAELMTDGTTTATQCAYCGNPAVIPENIEGGVKPDKVVPFKVTKEEAARLFEGYFEKKRLLPNVFLNTRNQIAEMRKLYVPYWLFDLGARADMVFDAQKTDVSRQGDWEITRTKHYMVRRAGSLEFESIPVDASSKLDDQIGESLEPYDLSDAVPFRPAVLAGAMADRADVDAEQCQARAVQRVENSAEQAMRDTVNGYDSVSVRKKYIESHNGKVTPALMPVWLITTEKRENGEKKVYTFAINGQTGELTCDVPYAKGKACAWFLGIFFGVAALGYMLLVALKAMGVIG